MAKIGGHIWVPRLASLPSIHLWLWLFLRSKGILRSKEKVSTADFAQPHRGELLGIKKSKTSQIPQSCGKELKLPRFVVCPSPQVRTWPSPIFTSPLPLQEWQSGKQNHHGTYPPPLTAGAALPASVTRTNVWLSPHKML